MTMHNHMPTDSWPQDERPIEAVVSNLATADNSIISLKINRQTLTLSALVVLLIISAIETIELTRLHSALRIWQTLPAAVGSTSASTTPTTAGGNTLPSQVGGC